jgi:hypothetical protein
MAFRLQGKRVAWVRVVYVLCLAAGTSTHASILARHGWRWDYGGKPIGTVLFWTALTILVPLVAVLLFVRPRLGIMLLTLLMLSDVIHNNWVIYFYGGVVWMVADQRVFLTFVLATAWTVWKATRKQIQSQES